MPTNTPMPDPTTLRAELERLVAATDKRDRMTWVEPRVAILIHVECGGEVLGIGETESAALADAIETVKGWERG